MIKASASVAKLPMKVSSSAVNTFPVGFDGLHNTIAFGRLEKARRSSSRSKSNRGGSDQLGRRIEVRKTLGEVDCSILMGDPGHLSDDRFREPAQSVGGGQHLIL